MRVISNIIWFILSGFWMAIAWCAMGVLCCLTIIGIPFGIQCFKLAGLSLFPYGKRVKLDYPKHPVANLIWALLFGWELALMYLISGIMNCITIIGIGHGIQSFKLMKLAFFPFGATYKKGK